MTKEELRTEFNRPSFKQALEAYHGKRCVNCGSDEQIVFHHIVPLADGGTNCITNIVPLCWLCHQKAHGSVNIRERYKAEKSGRKPKQLNNIEENVQRYINCEIGSNELKELLGMPKGSHLADSKAFTYYLNSIGIKSLTNNVDILNSPKMKGKNRKKDYKAKIVYL